MVLAANFYIYVEQELLQLLMDFGVNVSDTVVLFGISRTL